MQPKDSIIVSKEGEVNKEKPIGGIVEGSLKLNEINTSEKLIPTDNNNSNGNKTPSVVVTGFVSQAEVKNLPLLPQAESS